MELQQKYIKRIDSFLERLECEYIDIRFEMVDHIATEIEEKVTNYDDFFQKKGMRGKFLGYMMTRKKELLELYYQQSKKQFWFNFKFIFKSIFKELLNIEYIGLVVFSFVLMYYTVQLNIIYTAFFMLVVGVLSFAYSSFVFNKEVKKYGKLRLVHTFISMSSFPLLLMNPIYNAMLLIKNNDTEEMAYIVSYYYLIYIIFNTLLVIIFIKNRNVFKEKYKYLLN